MRRHIAQIGSDLIHADISSASGNSLESPFLSETARAKPYASSRAIFPFRFQSENHLGLAISVGFAKSS